MFQLLSFMIKCVNTTSEHARKDLRTEGPYHVQCACSLESILHA